jgi:hypothetical protein
MKFLITALYLGGALHFGILIASALAPRALDWRKNLAPLPELLRQMFWVYGAFIVLMIISFGTLTLFHAETLASGSPLARSVCAMIAVFWAVRLGVQFFVFDAKPFLTNWLYRIGYHGLTVVFILLVAIYGWAATGYTNNELT